MKVFIIGTGNVATILGKNFSRSGHSISGVLGRTKKHVDLLAAKLKCKGYTDPGTIPVDADIYVVAIKDDALESLINSLPRLKGVVAHTSGSVSMKVLKKFKNHGVFYPVETIRASHSLSLKKIPVCIEASNEISFRKLMQLARTVSGEIYSLDSVQRSILHLAAVYTNNFTNALLGIAIEILDKGKLPAELLKPLAETTVRNAFDYGTMESQTGPAKRNDQSTIQKHLEMLSDSPEFQQLYRLFSRRIRNVHKKK